MHGECHRGVPERVRNALLGWLPAAEYAVSVRDVAEETVEAVEAVEALDEGAAPVGVGLVVADRPTLSGAEVVVACAGHDRAAPALAVALAPRAMREGRLEVGGPAGLARAVAEGVAAEVGGEVELVMAQRLMVAGSPRPASEVAGRGRRFDEGDRRVVAGWLDAFAVEALGAEARGADHWLDRLDDPAWQLWLWEVEGAPVSLVNGRSTTPVSSRLGPVYTPPEQRGRGYGSALTAHVAAALLAAGDERVTLFTDETNATSNAMYTRVGFADVTAHGSWLVRTAS